MILLKSCKKYMEMRDKFDMKYSVVDMFCGAGGLSKGFLDAGYDVKFGIDWDDAALLTFSKNHGDAEAFKLDLFDLDNVSQIEKK